MGSLFVRLVAFFVPAGQVMEGERSYRQQLFVITNLILVVVMLLTQLYGAFISRLDAANMAITLAFTVPLQLVLLGSLIYFRRCDNFAIAVRVSLGVMFASLALVVFFLGGPLGGVAVMMLFVPPLLAFVLLGLRDGLVWTGIGYLLLLAGGIAEILGFRFPYIDNTPHAAVGKMIHLHVSFFSVFLVIAFYEASNQRYRERLEEVARRDDLTSLPNRSAFYRAIEAAIAEYEMQRTPFTLIYIDLDNFKPVNDAHGHSAGDQVLCAFAGRLVSSVRKQDFVCRLGGDEFALLLKGTTDTHIAETVVERLQERMQVPIDLRNGKSIAISASTGVAYYPHDAESLEAILHAADERMYKNKRRERLGWLRRILPPYGR